MSSKYDGARGAALLMFSGKPHPDVRTRDAHVLLFDVGDT